MARHPTTFPFRALLGAAYLLAACAPVLAQQEGVDVGGVVQDMYGDPVVGYRVVFRGAQDDPVRLATPTDDSGGYRVALEPGVPVAPVALIAPNGARVSLDGRAPSAPTPGARWDIRLTRPLPRRWVTVPAPFVGADRRFLGFVEDAITVERQRFEVQLDLQDRDGEDVRTSRLSAAFQLSSLPRVELGGRVGFGGVEGRGGLPDGTGLTDLDLWAKLHLAPAAGRAPDLAVGAVLTLPTGDERHGLGFDAMRGEVFAAARFPFWRFVLSTHAGVVFHENGRIGGLALDGRAAPTVGIAALVPATRRLAWIAEAVWVGERFEGGQPDARALLGIHAKPARHGSLRVALAAGLDDGAPDVQGIVGYAFDF